MILWLTDSGSPLNLNCGITWQAYLPLAYNPIFGVNTQWCGDGLWHNLVFRRFANDSGQIWLDGKFNTSVGTFADMTSLTNSSLGVMTWTTGGKSGYFRQGYMDEFNIWNRSLSDSEIATLQTLAYPFVVPPVNISISNITCTSCNPPYGSNTTPYVTGDTTPTFTLTTNDNSYCRIGNESLNFTEQGDSRNCTSGEGATAHTCTVIAEDALTPPYPSAYVVCSTKTEGDIDSPITELQMDLSELLRQPPINLSQSLNISSRQVNASYNITWANGSANTFLDYIIIENNNSGSWINTSYIPGTIYSYQESANTSNQTGVDGGGMNYSGGYFVDSGDGGAACGAAIFYINYTPPSGYISALWQLKYGNDSSAPSINISIPQDCIITKLQLKIENICVIGALPMSSSCFNYTSSSWAVINSTLRTSYGASPASGDESSMYDGDWATFASRKIFSTSWSNTDIAPFSRVYEEAIWWYIVPQISLFNLNTTIAITASGGSTVCFRSYANSTYGNMSAAQGFLCGTVTDSCTPPAINNDWNVAFGDNCSLAAPADLGTGKLSVTGSGTLTIASELALHALSLSCSDNTCKFIVNPTGKLKFT
jgi:hypothetical protein